MSDSVGRGLVVTFTQGQAKWYTQPSYHDAFKFAGLRQFGKNTITIAGVRSRDAMYVPAQNDTIFARPFARLQGEFAPIRLVVALLPAAVVVVHVSRSSVHFKATARTMSK